MSTTKAQIESAIKTALDYPSYMTLMQELVHKGMSTGLEQSDALTNYTLLNNKRMKRLNKTLSVSAQVQARIQNYPKDIRFLVLTESWCGDAAQSLPMVSKIAACQPNWSVRGRMAAPRCSASTPAATSSTRRLCPSCQTSVGAAAMTPATASRTG